MKIHDITRPVFPGMLVWPDNPPMSITRALDQTRGDVATVSNLALGAHTGTHIDAPLHFVLGGAGVEAIALETLCGPAEVRHALEAEALTAEVFEQMQLPPGTTRLLVRTRNSERWARAEQMFDENYVAITAAGARWLVEHGIRVIGVDYLTVAPFADLITTHLILLQAGVVPLESLDLGRIAPGAYTLYCLPLKLVNCDGAPARVMLVENEHGLL